VVGVAVGEVRTRVRVRPGDRRLMMPDQVISQLIADPPPGPGACPVIATVRSSRTESSAGVCEWPFAPGPFARKGARR